MDYITHYRIRSTTMVYWDIIHEMATETPSRIVMMVLDGLGGLPHPDTGKSELETAQIPNLNALAQGGSAGLVTPVGPGITPGSGPAHLALFGYDPIENDIGRGVLEALGLGAEVGPTDVSVRGNFCTVNGEGIVTDRRAGRIASEESATLCRGLQEQVRNLDGVQVDIAPGREHRFAVVFRGAGLSPEVTGSDPQHEGVPPASIVATKPQGARMAEIANRFVSEARSYLAERPYANMVMVRGFSQFPQLPSMSQRFKLHPACIASYPMYRGLAQTVGMDILPTGATLQDEIDTLKQYWDDYTYFFVHYKKTDTAGEDGNFEAKVQALEEFDAHLPQVLALKPDVLIVTGDHSTPATVVGHSWHPVPLVLQSRWTRPRGIDRFSEAACAGGDLGQMPSLYTLPIAMAHAQKLAKYGA